MFDHKAIKDITNYQKGYKSNMWNVMGEQATLQCKAKWRKNGCSFDSGKAIVFYNILHKAVHYTADLKLITLICYYCMLLIYSAVWSSEMGETQYTKAYSCSYSFVDWNSIAYDSQTRKCIHCVVENHLFICLVNHFVFIIIIIIFIQNHLDVWVWGHSLAWW